MTERFRQAASRGFAARNLPRMLAMAAILHAAVGVHLLHPVMHYFEGRSCPGAHLECCHTHRPEGAQNTLISAGESIEPVECSVLTFLGAFAAHKAPLLSAPCVFRIPLYRVPVSNRPIHSASPAGVLAARAPPLC
jgi:hypothetical protein